MTTPSDNSIRDAILLKEDGFAGVDATNPKSPSGHAYGIRTSTRLTSNYRQTHRKTAVDVTPQEVMDCIEAAGVSVVRKINGVGFQPAVFNSQSGSLFIPQIFIVRLPRACLVGERVWEPDRAYPESLFSSLLAASGGQQV